MQKNHSRLILLCIIYGNMILYGFVLSMRGVLFPLVKNTYGASYNQQGLLVSLVSFVSVLSCAAAGIILGRLGFRKTIGLGFGIIILGMFFFRFAGTFWITASLIIFIQFGLGFFDITLNGMGVKTFTQKSAMMMSLLHFFYGLGAILGPWFGGVIANNPNLGWRNIYISALAPVVFAALLTVVLSPSKSKESGDDSAGSIHTHKSGTGAGRGGNFRWAVTNPAVWQFGICMGFTAAVDNGTINWGGLYLQDVFGMDPKTAGAAFISAYFFLYTLSRLAGGFFIEKIGYIRSILSAVVISLMLLTAGFVLGRRGIWVLPVTGFFIGIVFPTILAMSIGVFREKAQAASGVILVISVSLYSVTQYMVGLVNRFAGEAWGYRTSVVYGIILLFLLTKLRGPYPPPRKTPNP